RLPQWRDVLPRAQAGRAQLFGQSRRDRPGAAPRRPARAPHRPRRGRRVMTDRAPRNTTLQKLLSRFHFGITLLAVALSGITILLAGITAMRGHADRNIELAAQLGAYGVEPALVFNDP